MADVDLNSIRPTQPLAPVRRIEKPARDKDDDAAQRRKPPEDDEEQPLVDTFA